MSDYAINTVGGLLKIVYSDKDSVDQILNNFPALGLIKRTNDFTGENYQFSMYGAGGQGVSVDFASAVANATAGTAVKPIVSRGQLYGFGTLQREAMLACKGKKGAFEDLVKRSKKDLDQQIRRTLGGLVMGDGGGAFGQIKAGSAVNTTTLTLASKASVVFFERGQTIQTSVNNGTSGTVKAGSAKIAAVNPTTGTLTLEAALNSTIGTVAAGDYIFIGGNAGVTTGKTILGFPAWIPRTDPVLGVDSFNGIDRGVDPFRFAGVRYITPGATIKSTMLTALAVAGLYGAEPKIALMNPLDAGALNDSLDNKTNEVRVQARDAEIGYSGFKLYSPTMNGSVTVLSDASVPVGDCWVIDPDDWEFKYLTESGTFPEIFQTDGSVLMRISGSDKYEFRMGGYGNVVCYKPANQLYVKLPSNPLAA